MRVAIKNKVHGLEYWEEGRDFLWTSRSSSQSLLRPTSPLAELGAPNAERVGLVSRGKR